MAENWRTISVKLTEEEVRALDILCERRKIARNWVIQQLVRKEIEPIITPSVVPEDKGLPLMGDNVFRYVAATDSFVWQLDRGVASITALAEDVQTNYLNNLKKAIEKGLQNRDAEIARLPKGKAIIPDGLNKYTIKHL